MTFRPKTLAEWSAYTARIPCERLFEKVERANSITFVRQLKADGLAATEIKAVFEGFVRRLVECQELPPGGGYYDLRKILEELDRAT